MKLLGASVVLLLGGFSASMPVQAQCDTATTSGSSNVFIDGKPAQRIGDAGVDSGAADCANGDRASSDEGNAGSNSVFVNGKAANRLGDWCGTDIIKVGSASVLINGKPAAYSGCQ